MTNPPLSHTVLVRDIGPKGRTEQIIADATERAALAESMGIPEVKSLMADLSIYPARGGAFHVRGTLKADLVQTDVVTLEPVEQHAAEEIDLTLLPAEAAGVTGEAVLIDPMAEDAPDVFHRGRIDLGVIVAEHLALGLDPYPRAPDSQFEPHIEDEAADRISPFAKLKHLKGGGH